MKPEYNAIFVAVVSALTSSGFMSLLIYLLQRRDRKKEKEEAKTSAQSRMLLGLAHDRIVSLTDKYVQRGGITLKEKRNLQALYDPYKDSGGNGDCKIGFEACEKLAVLSDEEASDADQRLLRKELGLEA